MMSSGDLVADPAAAAEGATPVPVPEVASEDGETLTLMTWNINCLLPTVANMKLRHKGFRGFLDHFGVDIACFQEVKLPDARITKEVACVEGFQSFWATSKAKPGYSGVTTWCRCPAAAPHDAAADCLGGEERPELDTEGRMVQTDHGAFVLINVYVPNAGDRPARARLPYKLAFLRALRARMDELTLQGRQVIAVGDFNVAADRVDVHPAIDFDSLYDGEELAELRSLLAAYPDVWRRLHPQSGGGGGGGAYTVWEERTSARAFNVGLRIDYVLVSPGLLPCVACCDILPAAALPPKWSDHAAILMRMRVARDGTEQEGRPASEAAGAPSAPATAIPTPGPDPSVTPDTSALDSAGPPLSTDAAAASGGAPSTGGAPASTTGSYGTPRPPPRLRLPPPPATPCAQWLALESRFIDRNQRTLRDIFGRRPGGSAPDPNNNNKGGGGTAAGGGAAGCRKRGAPEGGHDPGGMQPPPAPPLRTESGPGRCAKPGGVPEAGDLEAAGQTRGSAECGGAAAGGEVEEVAVVRGSGGAGSEDRGGGTGGVAGQEGSRDPTEGGGTAGRPSGQAPGPDGSGSSQEGAPTAQGDKEAAGAAESPPVADQSGGDEAGGDAGGPSGPAGLRREASTVLAPGEAREAQQSPGGRRGSGAGGGRGAGGGTRKVGRGGPGVVAQAAGGGRGRGRGAAGGGPAGKQQRGIQAFLLKPEPS